MRIKIILAGAMLAALSACATTGGEDARGWREIDALLYSVVFVDDGPAIRDGDIVTYDLAYVWQADDSQGRGWQLYDDVQSDCANNLVLLGHRTLRGEDGAVQVDETKTEWEGIAAGGIADIATKAKCEGVYPEDPLVIGPDQDLMSTARAWLREQE